MIGPAPLSFSVILSQAFEQRIALELPLHVGGKVEIGELQQLDGLHQLRRHHQRMALANFESLSERHLVLKGRPPGPASTASTQPRKRAIAIGPIFAYRVLGPVYTRSTKPSLRGEQRRYNSGDNRECTDSEARIIVPQPRLRTSESK